MARAPLRIALVSETWPPDVNGVAYTLARLVEGRDTFETVLGDAAARRISAPGAGSRS